MRRGMKLGDAKDSPPPPPHVAVVEELSDVSTEGNGRRTGRLKSKKIAEAAGGTTAECAAICCCCPCGVLNLMVLALYKLPVCMCRKMWRKRKLRQKKKNALLRQRSSDGPSSDSFSGENHMKLVEGSNVNTVDFDGEMWTRFDGAGFWRSSSQRSV